MPIQEAKQPREPKYCPTPFRNEELPMMVRADSFDLSEGKSVEVIVYAASGRNQFRLKLQRVFSPPAQPDNTIVVGMRGKNEFRISGATAVRIDLSQ